MFIFRLIFVLFAISALVLLGLYLLVGNKKYLYYFKQTAKTMLYMVLTLAVFFVARRILFI